jgi:hypothetical protein
MAESPLVQVDIQMRVRGFEPPRPLRTLEPETSLVISIFDENLQASQIIVFNYTYCLINYFI